MFQLFLPLLFCLRALSGGLPAEPGAGAVPLTVRVLTYNIHHANPPAKPDSIDLDAIAAVINAQRPDVVALQEVDVRTQRSGVDLDEAVALGKRTGLHAWFAKAIPYGGGKYGVAILSRFPVRDGRAYALPTAAGSGGEPRVLATLVCEGPGNRSFMMACTHLDVQRVEATRLMQVGEIRRILGQAGMPVIVAGDFNAVEGSGTIRALDSSFTRSCQMCPPTIPVDLPKRAIDFIAYAPAAGFEVIQHQVIDERYASDHLPVLAVLRLK